jgi:MoaA/NifB/PqqE/SkfB family radical SAM enzyme
MVMATNGTLLTPQVTEKMKASGIKRVSISLDGAMNSSTMNLEKCQGLLKGPWKGSGF